jgi:hypothetical protein
MKGKTPESVIIHSRLTFRGRWGDAPVHSLAVAMMLKTSEVHFFNDIGYKHNPLMHCPFEPWAQKKCWCNDKENFGKLSSNDCLP